nr:MULTISPECIES: ogr/Delta-like zinc finger family protein [Enterobacter]
MCGQAASTPSSLQVSSESKEHYNQCTNIECGYTFLIHETFVSSVCRPQKISAAPPYRLTQKVYSSNLLTDKDPLLAGFFMIIVLSNLMQTL